MIKFSKEVRLVSVFAFVLLFGILVSTFSSNERTAASPTISSEQMKEGYKITVDSETVCIVDDEKTANQLIDDLLTKAKLYYSADKVYSPVNEIEVLKGEFKESAFLEDDEAKALMGVDVILGSPTVETESGEKITLSLSEMIIAEKFVETDFETKYEYTYGVSQSYEKVLSEGEKGVIKQLYNIKEINGEKMSETLVLETVLSEATDRVVEIGVTPSMQLASAELAFFIKPYDGKISSDYGYRYLNGYEFHTGIDIVAKSGSCNGKTAVAAADGVVVESGYSSSRGNYVIIEHEYGFSTVYMHFKKRLVSAGDTVSAGDPIGLIGSTGRSTGPHLHFEIRLNGKHTNPENYLSFK